MDNALDEIDPIVLGQCLKEAREKAGITPAQAGCHVGSSTTWVHLVELGRTRINPADLIHLAELYQVPVHILLNGPLPYATPEEAIRACSRGELSEGMLAWFLKCDIVQARYALQQYREKEIPVYPDWDSAQEALDRGETVCVEMESYPIDPRLIQLALDLQAKQYLEEWKQNQQNEDA